MHCWYEDFLAASAARVLFSDTDAFTTAVFHGACLGEPARGFDDLVRGVRAVRGVRPDLEHDGWREVERRDWMHQRYVEATLGRAGRRGCSWRDRTTSGCGAAEAAVDRLLGAARPVE